MKTMTLRLLFTVAILAGLAAAPDAQTFRWEPNRSLDTIGDRVERAIDQAQRSIDRQWRTFERQWELRARTAERTARLAHQNAERRADHHRAHRFARIALCFPPRASGVMKTPTCRSAPTPTPAATTTIAMTITTSTARCAIPTSPRVR